MNFHLKLCSSNAKTGPIPVSTSSADTCPPECSLKDNGCYAELGPLRIHWTHITSGKRGTSWEQHVIDVHNLPAGTLWRMFQAGDFPHLPGKPGHLDPDKMVQIAAAARHTKPIAFTHYHPGVGDNYAILMAANYAGGLQINLSTETLSQVDAYANFYPGLPMVTLLPEGQTKPTRTPAGIHVIVCPASIRDDTTCATCGICATARRAVVGFPVHGARKRAADAVRIG